MRKLFCAICLTLLSQHGLAQDYSGGSPTRIEADVKALVEAAHKLTTAWPWQPPIAQVATVSRHGTAAGPLLVAELRYESEAQEAPWDIHVEQQVELALCKIYGEPAESGRTVYGVRSFERENKTVRTYWLTKVMKKAQSVTPADPRKRREGG